MTLFFWFFLTCLPFLVPNHVFCFISSSISAGDPEMIISMGQSNTSVQFTLSHQSPNIILPSGSLPLLVFDDKSACGSLPLFDKFSRSFNSSAVLVDYLGCSAAWYDRAIQIQMIGANAVIFVLPPPPKGVPNARGSSLTAPLFGAKFSASIKIPVIFVEESDASLFFSIIATGNNITTYLPTTGPCHSQDKLALLNFAKNFSHNSYVDNVVSLMQFANNPSIDPCIDRVEGVTCIQGRITHLMYSGYGLIGPGASITDPDNWDWYSSMSPSMIADFNAFSCLDTLSELQTIDLSYNKLKAIPKLSSSNKLKVLEVARNEVFYTSSWYYGAYFNPDTLINKSMLLTVGLEGLQMTSQLPQLPSSLEYLNLGGNLWYNPPFTINDAMFPNLRYFQMDGCFLMVQYPSFRNFKSLEYLELRSGADLFNLTVDNKIFENIPTLKYLYFSKHQRLTNSEMFSFKNTTNLIDLELSMLGISGGFGSALEPIEMPYLKRLSLQQNRFSYPPLTYYDSPNTWNAIFVDVSTDCNDPRQKLRFNCGLQGPFYFKFPSLEVLDLSGNNISNSKLCPSGAEYCLDRFFLDQIPKSIRSISMYHNYLSGGVGYLPLKFLYLSSLVLSNNQFSSFGRELPVWAFQSLQILDVSFNNLNMSVHSSVKWPTSLQYLFMNGNPSLKGAENYYSASDFYFGSGVEAYVLFNDLTKNKFEVLNFSCIEPTPGTSVPYLIQIKVDPEFYSFRFCNCQRGFYGNPQSEKGCRPVPYLVSVSQGTSISDFDYGLENNERYSTGLSVIWNLNSISAKVIHFEVYLNSTFFNSFSDSVEIYEGGITLEGDKLLSIQGNKLTSSSTFTILAPTKEASVRFFSKKDKGKLFIMKISFSPDCPNGMMFYEPLAKCFKVYYYSSSLQSLIYALMAFALCCGLGICAIVYKKRQSLVIKSSSVPFCFAMIFFLVIMSFSSIFYAVYPRENSWVCHFRPWFSTASIVGVLGSLLLKADRIRKIFSSTELIVQSISNAQLFKILFIFLLIQAGISCFFSASGLGDATTTIGNGASANHIVFSCGNASIGNSNFGIWFGIECFYLSLFLIYSVYIAWGIRKVPSAFNESSSISSCLLSLFVLLLIIVPLNFVVDENPDALILIRGVGQISVALIMMFFFFGSKIFYILEGRENDKVLSSMGTKSSTSSNSSTSSTTSK